MQIAPSTIDWSTIRQHLAPGLRIPSHSSPDRTFEIERIEAEKLYVWPINAARSPKQLPRRVPRHDFEIVLDHWDAYHSAAGFTIPTQNNTYCLGIIAHVLRNLEANPHRERGV